VTGRRGRRRRKLLDNLKERRGYAHLKKEALDRSMWRVRFGRSFEPVVRQANKLINECNHRICLSVVKLSVYSFIEIRRGKCFLFDWMY
jgi:hypothetical protein